MGIYADYLKKNFNGNQLNQERKKQLKRICEIRKREVLVYASALTQAKSPIAIDYDDIVPFTDQLNNLKGDKIDIILETPGGSGEHAEHIIECIRKKFKEVAFIVPGTAMSAGTIMVMSGNEILMSPTSALGPIDAQIIRGGKQFSAQAFLDGLAKIKKEVEDTGILNKAYIPILQNISPGEIQSAQNAWDFAKELVAAWLAKYKFQNWETHSSTGAKVSEEEKFKKAADIAELLRDHGQWKTHGRRIRIEDLRKMGLKITDYSENNDLAEAIDRYFILLKMFFDAGTYFKVYETCESQIYRHTPIHGLPVIPANNIESAEVGLACPQCRHVINIQANFKIGQPLKMGFTKMPQTDKIPCPSCKKEIDLVNLKKSIETQMQRKIIHD